MIDAGPSERLLALHLGAAITRFGTGAMRMIDLPPIADGPVVPDQVRVAAVLLWCRELEPSGLPSAVEVLVAAFVEGALPLGAGPAAATLGQLVHGRSERFAEGERRALYDRMFDPAFDEAFDRLAAQLDEVARSADGPLAPDLVRIAVVGREVAQLVSARAVGMAAFAAREIMGDIRTGWALLNQREIQGILMAPGPWEALRRLRELRGLPSATPAVARATAGRAVLAWLADEAGRLSAGRVQVPPTVFEGAARWRMGR